MLSLNYRLDDTVERSPATYKVALMDIRSASDTNHVNWANRVEPVTSELPLKVGPKSGTTKVQLGAERAVGADSAEGRTCEFPKKIKNPQ